MDIEPHSIEIISPEGLLKKYEDRGRLYRDSMQENDLSLKEVYGYRNLGDYATLKPGVLPETARRDFKMITDIYREDSGIASPYFFSAEKTAEMSHRLIQRFVTNNPRLDPSKIEDNRVLAQALLRNIQNPSGHYEIYERGEVYIPEKCYVVETPLGLMFILEDPK